MSEILIQRAHTLGMEKARAIAAKWQQEAQADWGMDCTYVANKTNDQGEIWARLKPVEVNPDCRWELAEMISGEGKEEGNIKLAYTPEAWRQIVAQSLPLVNVF